MQPNLIAAFVVLLAVFVPVERLFALRRQKVFRKGWLTDFTHSFVSYFLARIGVFALVAVRAVFVHANVR